MTYDPWTDGEKVTDEERKRIESAIKTDNPNKQGKEVNNNRVFWKVWGFLLSLWLLFCIFETYSNNSWTPFQLVKLFASWLPYLIMLLGLFGYAFRKRIMFQKAWYLIFIGYITFIAYDAIDYYYLVYTKQLEDVTLVNIMIFLMQDLPMILSVFLYCFRSNDVWKNEKNV